MTSLATNEAISALKERVRRLERVEAAERTLRTERAESVRHLGGLDLPMRETRQELVTRLTRELHELREARGPESETTYWRTIRLADEARKKREANETPAERATRLANEERVVNVLKAVAGAVCVAILAWVFM